MADQLAARVRALPARIGRKADPWHPPEVGDLAQGIEIMAFDGSLSATGWADIIRRDSMVLVLDHGTLRPRTELKGYRGTYERATQLRVMIDGVLRKSNIWSNIYSRVAWEAPPVQGRRTESTLIAGWICYELAYGRGIDVPANHASKVLTGNPRHDKGEIKLAVARYVPEVLNRGWDEHQRDALAVGLTVLADMQAGVLSHPLIARR